MPSSQGRAWQPWCTPDSACNSTTITTHHSMSPPLPITWPIILFTMARDRSPHTLHIPPPRTHHMGHHTLPMSSTAHPSGSPRTARQMMTAKAVTYCMAMACDGCTDAHAQAHHQVLFWIKCGPSGAPTGLLWLIKHSHLISQSNASKNHQSRKLRYVKLTRWQRSSGSLSSYGRLPSAQIKLSSVRSWKEEKYCRDTQAPMQHLQEVHDCTSSHAATSPKVQYVPTAAQFKLLTSTTNTRYGDQREARCTSTHLATDVPRPACGASDVRPLEDIAFSILQLKPAVLFRKVSIHYRPESQAGVLQLCGYRTRTCLCMTS